jgi:hypothetical protein
MQAVIGPCELDDSAGGEGEERRDLTPAFRHRLRRSRAARARVCRRDVPRPTEAAPQAAAASGGHECAGCGDGGCRAGSGLSPEPPLAATPPRGDAQCPHRSGAAGDGQAPSGAGYCTPKAHHWAVGRHYMSRMLHLLLHRRADCRRSLHGFAPSVPSTGRSTKRSEHTGLCRGARLGPGAAPCEHPDCHA